MTLRVVNENGGWRFHEGYVKRGGGIFDLAWYHQPRWTSSEKSQDDSEEDKVSEHYEAVDPFIVAQVGRGQSVTEEEQGTEHAAKMALLERNPDDIVGDDPAHPIKRNEQQDVDSESSSDLRVEDPEVTRDKKSPANSTRVNERLQEVTLGDLQALSGFQHARPNFHICFYT
jgi:hypothetical protein